MWAARSSTAPGGNTQTHTRTHTEQPLYDTVSQCCWPNVFMQSEQTLLFDAMKSELLEKIRRLEEDRQNIDLTSGTPQTIWSSSLLIPHHCVSAARWSTLYALIPEWSDEMRGKKCKRKNLLGRSDRKRKVALVSGTSFPKISRHPFLQFYILAANFTALTANVKKFFACLTGPFIVYMLRDIDILEDWTAIKKVHQWIATFSCWLSLFRTSTI